MRSGPWLVGGATACMVLALVATGLVIMTAGSSDQADTGGPARVASLLGVPTTEAGVSRMPDAATIAAMVSAARPSVVAVSAATATGVDTGTGIVAESGGIIVTASQLVSGARTVTVVETNGARQSADIVGVDPHSGLAVLRIADDLPAASFDVADPAHRFGGRRHGAPHAYEHRYTAVAQGLRRNRGLRRPRRRLGRGHPSAVGVGGRRAIGR